MGIEILLAVLGVSFVLGLAAFALTLMFGIIPALSRLIVNKRYPIEIPGWKARVMSVPAMNASLEGYGEALDLFLDRCVEIKGYDKDALRKAIDTLRFNFIPPSNNENKRYIIDEYDRKISGDIKGEFVRVVYLPDDKVGNTAFLHEVAHKAHEIESVVDYSHKDRVMWDDIVKFCNAKLK